MLVSIGFFVLTSAGFTGFSNWLPQVRGEVPKEEKIEGDITALPTEKLAELGEITIFGKVGGFAERGIGKGQCPLCHTFKKGDIGDRAPNLMGITDRASERIADPRHVKPDTVQTEAFPGSGRATKGIEYIAESHACPDCYVVAGFGEKGTNDRNSPMPEIHKPPIALSIDELVAVDTWLFVNEGVEPPPPAEIKAAYEKFIPENQRVAAKPAAAADPCEKIACAADTPEQIIGKMGCAACHKIPSVEFAKIGAIGPLLAEGSNAPFRIKSPEYQAAMKAGKAHATSPKDYIIESIMDPSAFIAQGFEPLSPGGKSLMPADFATKFTYAAVSKLADFLLQQDASKAKAQGLTQHPMEKHKIL
jgi:cytochrome c2